VIDVVRKNPSSLGLVAKTERTLLTGASMEQSSAKKKKENSPAHHLSKPTITRGGRKLASYGKERRGSFPGNAGFRKKETSAR